MLTIFLLKFVTIYFIRWLIKYQSKLRNGSLLSTQKNLNCKFCASSNIATIKHKKEYYRVEKKKFHLFKLSWWWFYILDFFSSIFSLPIQTGFLRNLQKKMCVFSQNKILKNSKRANICMQFCMPMNGCLRKK
jgi:hypothetical protein